MINPFGGCLRLFLVLTLLFFFVMMGLTFILGDMAMRFITY
jgi:hypothetical protein